MENFMKRFLVAVSVVLLAGWVHAAPFDDCEDMVRMGVPGTKGTPLCRTGYATAHDPVRKTPIWVAEYLTREHAKKKRDREAKFKADPDLPEGKRAEDKDYTGSGWARGHMSPAANNGWSDAAMRDSFYLSNAVPQNSSINSGKWSQLEGRVRDWAIDRGALYIFTGPIYAKGIPVERIGKGKVAAPSYVFKVVYDPEAEESIAFIVENRKKTKSADTFVQIVSIEEIEKKTGLSFLTELSAAKRRATITSKAPALWQ